MIQEVDDKHPKMLMKVVRRTKDGLIRSVYLHPDHPVHRGVGRPKYYENRSVLLHDPARFGIKPDDDPYSWVRPVVTQETGNNAP